jgi:hypothetical protein
MLAGAWLFFLLEAGATAAPPPDQLEHWLQELDAEHYDAREAACRNLVEAGAAAVERLVAEVGSPSPEVAWRARQALAQIAADSDEPTLARMAAVLGRQTAGDASRVNGLAAELNFRLAQLRHDRAAAAIRALGGNLSTGNDDSISIEGFIDPAVVAPIEILPVQDELAVQRVLPPVQIDAQPPPPAPPPDDVPLEESGGLAPGDDAGAQIGDAFVGEVFMADAVVLDVEAASGDDVPSGKLRLDHDWRGDDADLRLLLDFRSVSTVSISSAKITDGALPHIAALPGLELLEIRANSSVTASGLRKFREARPNVQVYARGEALLGVHADPEGPCLLMEIVPGSAAEQAGLQSGDEVIAAAGAHIRDFSDLTIAVFSHKPGDKLAIEFCRRGERNVVEAVLADRAPPIAPCR